ncbi:copper resistance protein NlpE N-terminal domain-containing protein [Aureibaculum sp. 2210JD6-5]|uniref:copper resistance protein NlpE N-terminal domain-containing protein n=1 Tax=Aureibaculum sp. 2210JD6-5 TaxID=3103957 RepID=UPI002AACAA6F|nr:copper resistance protein NlpE N-terminal domain-containing protein [Aureibaculum sp. 2210JD6-5]MDY7395927.1 copper resistance protein NlpE N-terminal domain-containing protein [Aureibaculum sp. 2210JD6-5]
MKTINITIVLIVIIFSSCKSKQKFNEDDEKAKETVVDMHNSMNALDWNGTYQTVLPCADCEGINTVLILNDDLTYTKQAKYLGKKDTIFKDKGTFSWDKTGQIITLNNDEKNQYFVGENRIWMLDQDAKKITGPDASELAQNYIFNKQQTQLTNRHWKLVELNGQKVNYDKKSGNQPYIILRPDEENKVYGNAGCNRFFGTFELKEGNQIAFSQLGATKMYCSNMETEKQFLEILRTADNFSLSGETMTLNKAKMAPLAKFEVAYFE